MFRILLILCSFVLGISANNSTSISFNVSLTPSPSIHAATSLSMSMSMSVPVSPTALPSNSSAVYTTSAHPNVTVSPTHMPHSTNATSAVPTTSSAVPTPKPPPTTPPPTFGVYNVHGKKNDSLCLLAELDVTIHVEYVSSVVLNATAHTTKNESKTADIHIPYPHNDPNVTMSGSMCGENSSALTIKWPLFIFGIKFVTVNAHNGTNVTGWKVAEMSLYIDTKDNKNFKNPVGSRYISAMTSHIPLKGQLGSSYKCEKAISYNVSGVMVDLTHVKLQPFNVVNNTYSGDFQECPQDTPTTPKPKDNNIVPIAVGCALAGLVLIVLIAYIIGRRKSQRGYEKV